MRLSKGKSQRRESEGDSRAEACNTCSTQKIFNWTFGTDSFYQYVSYRTKNTIIRSAKTRRYRKWVWLLRGDDSVERGTMMIDFPWWLVMSFVFFFSTRCIAVFLRNEKLLHNIYTKVFDGPLWLLITVYKIYNSLYSALLGSTRLYSALLGFFNP